MAASVLITKDVQLPPSSVLKIKSPGYPDVNYKKDTVLIWKVTAPATTQEILIEIVMDIIIAPIGLCEDYLKVFPPKIIIIIFYYMLCNTVVSSIHVVQSIEPRM